MQKSNFVIHCWLSKQLSRNVCRYDLLLFLPRISEENELLNALSYAFLYNENIDIIEQNHAEVENHTEIISKAIEQFHTYGPRVYAFDAVSSNTCTVQENEDE